MVVYDPLVNNADGAFEIIFDELSIHSSKAKVKTDFPVEEIIESAGKRYGIPVIHETPVPQKNPAITRLSLDVWIQEERFIKGLDSKSSITAFFTLEEVDSHNIFVRMVYTEESLETLDNFYHLYEIIDLGMKHIAYELTQSRADVK
jgi:hypothetical protein